MPQLVQKPFATAQPRATARIEANMAAGAAKARVYGEVGRIGAKLERRGQIRDREKEIERNKALSAALSEAGSQADSWYTEYLTKIQHEGESLAAVPLDSVVGRFTKDWDSQAKSIANGYDPKIQKEVLGRLRLNDPKLTTEFKLFVQGIQEEDQIYSGTRTAQEYAYGQDLPNAIKTADGIRSILANQKARDALDQDIAEAFIVGLLDSPRLEKQDRGKQLLSGDMATVLKDMGLTDEEASRLARIPPNDVKKLRRYAKALDDARETDFDQEEALRKASVRNIRSGIDQGSPTVLRDIHDDPYIDETEAEKLMTRAVNSKKPGKTNEAKINASASKTLSAIASGDPDTMDEAVEERHKVRYDGLEATPEDNAFLMGIEELDPDTASKFHGALETAARQQPRLWPFGRISDKESERELYNVTKRLFGYVSEVLKNNGQIDVQDLDKQGRVLMAQEQSKRRKASQIGGATSGFPIFGTFSQGDQEPKAEPAKQKKAQDITHGRFKEDTPPELKARVEALVKSYKGDDLKGFLEEIAATPEVAPYVIRKK